MITPDEVRGVPLFSAVDDEHIRRVAARAADVRLSPGDWAAREGEPGAFFVLLDGCIEITKFVGGEHRVLAERGPNDFFGEVPLLLGAPFLASFRANVASRALRLNAADVAVLVNAAPTVRQAVSEALLARVGGVEEATTAARRVPVVVGSAFDLACHNMREFLARNFVEFEWLDPTNDDERPWIPAPAQRDARYPSIVLADGTLLVQPSLRDLACAVGLRTVPDGEEYDVVIIGGGPSGLSAAVYGASEGLRTLMIEGTAPGGQAGSSSRIENYLGFPIGVSGDELGARALTQATRFGAEIVVTRRVCAIQAGAPWHVLTLEDGVTVRARAIVLSIGVAYRALHLPGLEQFVGAGVYYGAARTEALSTRGRSIYLIGGGNSAGQAAMFFSNYAAQVTLLVRGPSLAESMSSYLIDQLASRSNIAVKTNQEMTGVHGRAHLEEIDIYDRVGKTTARVGADGVFIFIGADANSEWLPGDLARDDHGFILTGRDIAPAGAPDTRVGRDPYLLETSVPGIFAAGDVRHGSMKRVASAVGEGSMSIAFIHQYLAAATA